MTEPTRARRIAANHGSHFVMACVRCQQHEDERRPCSDERGHAFDVLLQRSPMPEPMPVEEKR